MTTRAALIAAGNDEASSLIGRQSVLAPPAVLQATPSAALPANPGNQVILPPASSATGGPAHLEVDGQGVDGAQDALSDWTGKSADGRHPGLSRRSLPGSPTASSSGLI